jgi:methylenetetrahydrofolate dehydrogenase (NADP+) / methenyltetrahydrofolate cyclohydrolase
MPYLYSNNPIKSEFKAYLQQEFAKLKEKANKEFVLNIVQIGHNLASSKYVGIKKKIGLELGVVVNHHHFEDGIGEQKLVDLYNYASDNGQGFIFQLPLPPQYSHLVPLTPLNTDVDLLSSSSFLLWSKGFLPPTIGAIDLIYKEMEFRKEFGLIAEENIFGNKETLTDTLEKVDLISQAQKSGNYNHGVYFRLPFGSLLNQKADYTGKIVAVVGQGILVGSPLVKYLLDRNATIISVNKDTPNSKALTSQADVIFSGAGVVGLINRDWIKKDAIVIDAATSGVGGEIFGDVNKDDIDDSTYLCPSPKGVGPITVLYIFWNLLKMVG